mmetsp:Transcript_30831/g.74964  ORF Transcript_30831/g.74964 Transcript_30831/m.74964 type:complete len:136 (-) Transcript_30831:1564-1971(-)
MLPPYFVQTDRFVFVHNPIQREQCGHGPDAPRCCKLAAKVVDCMAVRERQPNQSSGDELGVECEENDKMNEHLLVCCACVGVLHYYVVRLQTRKESNRSATPCLAISFFLELPMQTHKVEQRSVIAASIMLCRNG